MSDRSFFDFALIQHHIDISIEIPTPFVMRMREPGERSPKFHRLEGRPREAKDLAAGVISDHVGRLAGSQHRDPPDGLLREVVIRSPDEPGGVIRLVTNLLDVPAWVIGLLYRSRWQVELFFRWLKATAWCDRRLM